MTSPVFPIQIVHGLRGAAGAGGLVVVIDVLRAFSSACYAISKGARGVIPVDSVKKAFELRKKHPDWMIMGERGGIRVQGFDFGNSPSEINAFGSLQNRMIIHATSNGTRGIVAAENAEIVLTGGFVNARAIADYIQIIQPEQVDLVCMGTVEGPAIEDDLCAAYIKGLIQRKQPDANNMFDQIRNHPSTLRFRSGNDTDFPLDDLNLCLRADIFNFVLYRETCSEGGFILHSRSLHKDRVIAR